MNWEDLRLFLAVYEALSFTAAASHLKVGQATLSRRVASLEGQLGRALFRRVSRGLEPTEAAHALAREIAPMTSAARRGLEVVRTFDEAAEGVVRVAMPEAVAVDLFPALLPGIAARWPGIRLELLGGNEPVDLERGEADFAIRSVREPRGRVVYRRLPDLPLEVFCSAEYLASRPDVDALSWITWDAAHEDLPDAQWVRARLGGRSPALRASSVPAMRAAAQRGLGCVVLARWHGDAVGLVRVPHVGAELPAMPWYVAYTPAARRVRRVRVVLEHFLDAVARAEHVDRWPPPG